MGCPSRGAPFMPGWIIFSDAMTPIVELNAFAYAYPARDAFVLHGIDLTVAAGECHCITGPTGSGKSTLLQAIQGLLPAGKSRGRIRVCGNGSRGPSGLVLQEPDMQILTKNIGQEVAFGLENLCIPAEQMTPLVRRGLEATGLDKALGFETRKLSMGQKYRLLLASLLVMKPKLLMLDEPSGQLDGAGLEKLENVLSRLKETGMAILISEHRPEALAGVIDKYWLFDPNAGLQAGTTPAGYNTSPIKAPPAGRVFDKKARVSGSPVISAEAVSIGFDDVVLWSDATFRIYPGEIISIYGENGSGKTSLLRCLMGMVEIGHGLVHVFGKKPAPRKLRGKIGCLFQNPSKQLFENTVFDEVAFQVKRICPDNIEQAVNQALNLCGISDLSGASPHKLSYGQKHLVALASVIGAAPELLLLDDPFSGLDQSTKGKLTRLFHRLSREKGTTIVLTTHHMEADMIADRRIVINNRRITEEAA